MVLSENPSLTDLRLKLERVGVVFQASSVQVKGNVASGSRYTAPAHIWKSVQHFEDCDRGRDEERCISKQKQKKKQQKGAQEITSLNLAQ